MRLILKELKVSYRLYFFKCVTQRATHVATELDSRRPASASPEAPDLVVECTRDSVAWNKTWKFG